jgi:hypothetical protein
MRFKLTPLDGVAARRHIVTDDGETMSGIEGIGEVVSGGLVARAVEPEAGEARHGDDGGACLNCGAALAGPYCAQCGQTGHIHRTLAAFWHDLAHGVLHFEGKIWRTLPLLAWRPGELTRRYIAGERAKFVSPMAIFLFSVFMMFAIFSFVGGPFSTRGGAHEETHQSRTYTDPRQALRDQQAEGQAELARLNARRARRAADGRDTAEIDARIREKQADLRETERAIRGVIALTDGYLGAGNASAGATPEGAHADGPPRSQIPFLDAAFRHATGNPELLFYKVETNAYKFSWMLIPISVPFVWILFLHRRRYRRYKAYDHTVFVTYSLAFMSLGLVALSLLRQIGLPGFVVGLAIALVPPVHIFRQLRGAYELSNFSALWRTAALLIVATITTAIFFSLMMTLGALH